MKNRLSIVVLVVTLGSFFHPSAVKAENKAWNQDYTYDRSGGNSNSGYNNNNHNNGPSNNGTNNNGGPTTSSPTTSLPINGGVVFLFASGIAIGVVTLKKFKSLTPALAV